MVQSNNCIVDRASVDKWLDYIEDVVFQADPQLNLRFLNTAWNKHTGYEIENSIGKSLLAFFHSPINSTDQFTSTLLNRTSRLVLLKHADGSVAPYKITLYTEQSLNILSGVIKRQTEFPASQWRGAGVIMFDLEGKIISFNQEAQALLGYTQEEVLGIPLDQFFYTEDRARLQALSSEITSGGATRSEVLMQKKEGDKIWMRIDFSSIRDETGAIIAMYAVIHDISAEKLIATQLKKSEELKNALIQAFPDLLFVVDKEGTYREVYAKNENELVKPKEELIGKKLTDILPADVAEPYLQIIKKSIEQNEIHTLDYQLLLHGIKYWFEAWIAKNGEDQVVIIVRNVTDKVSANQQLKENEEKYRLLADNALDIIVLFSTDGKFHYISPSVSKILGFTREEYQEVLSYEEVHPDDRQLLKKSLEEIKYAVDEQVNVFRVKNKKGKYVWLESRKRLIEYDPKTDRGMVLSVSRDISEQKNAELSLRESESKYRLLAENISDVITLIDKNLNYLYVSPSVQKKLGYTPEEMLQMNVKDVMTPAALQLTIDAFRNRKKENEVIVTETEYIRKDGTLVWGENTTTILRNKQGKVSGYLATTRDIDERRKAEQALKDSEQNLKDALKIARMGSYEHDLETRKVVWSDEMYILTGMNPSQEIDMDSMMNLVHPEDREYLLNIFYTHIKQDQDMQVDFRLIRPDETVIFVSGIYKLIRNQEGKPIKIIGIIQDITDRKKAEEKIEKQNRELLKLNHELDNLIYSSSHDLRSPLTSALGLITIMQMEKDTQKKDDYLKLMEKSLQRLDNFTRDILDLYRNARSFPEIEQVDFDQIVSETLEEFQFLEASEKIEKIVRIKQSCPFYSESKRLKIILTNLISNAIRYHNLQQPHPFIEISGLADARHAILYVKDNGQGIDVIHINKIFDMFYRAHRDKKGSGLGLYLVKETIEKLQGTISVSSVYGEGTTFIIELPNLKKNLC